MKITQLGDFILEKRVGSGGMGEVYRARQVSLDRVVAVKVLPRSLASQPGFTARFQREARAAANLIHPHVIQVYSIGLDKGNPYFAMEYVEGEDLQQRMKRQRVFDFDDVVCIIHDTTSALSVAHDKGIVHRDIKPSNIMFAPSGSLKVMDFGLAKITSMNSNLTQSGLIMGTPNYMSPEQGKGESTDTRSDIYSLGVVMYELMTGTLPFRANTPTALIYKHAYEKPPPPRDVNSEIPPFLEFICLKMMAKDPSDRYSTPRELLRDLEEFQRERSFYMSGGMPDNKAIMEEQTLIESASSGTVPSTMTVHDDDSNAAQSAVQTAEFQPGQTAGTTTHAVTSGVTAAGAAQQQTLLERSPLPPYRQTSSLQWVMFLFMLLILVATGVLYKDELAAKIREILDKNGKIEADKLVEFPLTELHAYTQSTQGVTIEYRQEGDLYFRPCPNATIKAKPVIYTFKLKRTGYVDNEFPVALKEDGQVDPPFSDRNVGRYFSEWTPSDNLLQRYGDATKAIGVEDWPLAKERLELVRKIDPKFRDTESLYEKVVANLGSKQQLIGKARTSYNNGLELFSSNNLFKAREEFVLARSTLEDVRVKNTDQALELKGRITQRLVDIEQKVELIGGNVEDGDDRLSKGEFSSANNFYSRAKTLNEDDTTIDGKLTDCENLMREFGAIKGLFDAGARDTSLQERLVAYLKRCKNHQEALQMRDVVVRELKVIDDRQNRIDTNLEAIRALKLEVNPTASDWKQVLDLAEEVLRDNPENAEATTYRERAERELNAGGIKATFEALGKALNKPEADRIEAFRTIVPQDREFEAEWRRFFEPEVQRKVQLLNPHFLVVAPKVVGDKATVDVSWEYLVVMREFGKTYKCRSELVATVVRNSDLSWVVESLKPKGVPTEMLLDTPGQEPE